MLRIVIEIDDDRQRAEVHGDGNIVAMQCAVAVLERLKLAIIDKMPKDEIEVRKE